jgi:hypothetical protein
VSSSTLGIVSCMHVDTPSLSESLGGGSLLNIKRDSAHMQRLSTRQVETENPLSWGMSIRGARKDSSKHCVQEIECKALNPFSAKKSRKEQ